MATSTTVKIEPYLRLTTGIILWTVSALLTASLFITIAGSDIFKRIIMLFLAIGLEGAKIISWRMGGKVRIFSICLIVLSLFASFGAALQTVEGSRIAESHVSFTKQKSDPSYIAFQDELKSIDTEIAILNERLQATPIEYVNTAKGLLASISDLRDRRNGIIEGMTGIVSNETEISNNSSMFYLISKTLGQPKDRVLLVLLLFLACCIEVGALVLTTAPRNVYKGDIKPFSSNTTLDEGRMASTTSYIRPIGNEEFLKAALEGSDYPFLCGRDRTAEKLGISSFDAKRFVKELIQEGRIIVEGKRLKVVEFPAPKLTKRQEDLSPLAILKT
jgi:hypothetical protein